MSPTQKEALRYWIGGWILILLASGVMASKYYLHKCAEVSWIDFGIGGMFGIPGVICVLPPSARTWLAHALPHARGKNQQPNA